MRFLIYPFPKIYALSTVFNNFRFSSFRWERKAELENFLSVFRIYSGEWKRGLITQKVAGGDSNKRGVGKPAKVKWQEGRISAF